ncbi:hypothetical protein PAMP_018194 [Pampus punctatissimus]
MAAHTDDKHIIIVSFSSGRIQVAIGVSGLQWLKPCGFWLGLCGFGSAPQQHAASFLVSCNPSEIHFLLPSHPATLAPGRQTIHPIPQSVFVSGGGGGTQGGQWRGGEDCGNGRRPERISPGYGGKERERMTKLRAPSLTLCPALEATGSKWGLRAETDVGSTSAVADCIISSVPNS